MSAEVASIEVAGCRLESFASVAGSRGKQALGGGPVERHRNCGSPIGLVDDIALCAGLNLMDGREFRRRPATAVLSGCMIERGAGSAASPPAPTLGTSGGR